MIKRKNEILYSMYARVSLVQQVIVRITAIAETILCQWNLLVHDTIMATQNQLNYHMAGHMICHMTYNFSGLRHFIMQYSVSPAAAIRANMIMMAPIT